MNQHQGLHVIVGTGPSGCATARALFSQGIAVRMVNRTGKRNNLIPSGVEVAAADAMDAASLRAAAAGAAVLYQCANAPYHRWEELFPPLQAGILQAAQALEARLVVLENLYMYGPVQGPMTEDLPYRPVSRKGRVRAALAEALLEAHARGDVQVAVGRASDFYGPGVTDSALGGRTFAPLVAGQPAAVMGDPDLLHTYSYIHDVGAGLATLGTQQRGFGEVWHLPAAPAVTTRQMLAEACRQAGLELRLRAMGRLMLHIGGLFIPAARESIEMLYQFEAPFVVDDTKFRRTFGGEATPFARGMAETLAWYRDRHAAVR